MKKVFYLIVILTIILVAGCTMPGPYMTGSDVLFSPYRNKNKVPKTTIIPISHPEQYADLLKYFETPYEYHVGTYDALGIAVVGHPELSMTFSATQVALVQPGQANNQYLASAGQGSGIQDVGYSVDTHGDILFPLVGNIHVAGLTIIQVRREIATQLSKYIRSPIVSVKVLTFNSQRVNVLGEVRTPGVRPLGDRALTILDAISLAGGIDPQTADMRHIFVLRAKGRNNIFVYWLDAKTPAALLLAQHFRLLDNDIVYVPPAGITDFNRFLNQILPPITTIWFTRSLVRD